MAERKDSVKPGDTFGKLTVYKYSYSCLRKDGSAGERVMLCKCDCGEEVEVRGSNLRSGNTLSCGCHHSEMSKKSNKIRGRIKYKIEVNP